MYFAIWNFKNHYGNMNSCLVEILWNGTIGNKSFKTNLLCKGKSIRLIDVLYMVQRCLLVFYNIWTIKNSLMQIWNSLFAVDCDENNYLCQTAVWVLVSFTGVDTSTFKSISSAKHGAILSLKARSDDSIMRCTSFDASSE